MKNARILPKLLFFSSILFATMACSNFGFGPTPTPTATPTNTPRPGPQSGNWDAAIAFALPSGTNLVQLSFTVAQSGDQIENWSMFDLATSSVSIGNAVAIVNNSFEIQNNEYVGNTSVTRDIQGTFTGPDSVKGTFDFSYGGYGSASGDWTGNPSKAKSTPAAGETPVTPTIFVPSATEPPTAAPVSGVPVITNVVLRVDTSGATPVIYQDIYFFDSDGDVNSIDYSIVSSTDPNVQTQGGAVNIPSSEQIAGTYITGTWGCGNDNYTLTLAAVLSDRKGHHSKPYQYTLVCGQG